MLLDSSLRLRPCSAVLACLITIGGCAPATVQELRADHAGKHAFEVEENYQAVYRTVVTQARKCHQTGLITAQMVVQGDLYPDIKSGHVSIAVHGIGGVGTIAAVDVAALSDARSRVDTFYTFSSWTDFPPLVEEWVKDKSQDCALKREATTAR